MKYQLLDPYIRYFFKTDKYMCSKVNTYADDYRLFLGIIDGCVLICEDKEYALNKNSIAIIPPKTFYRLKKIKNSEIVIMIFDMDSSKSYVNSSSPIPADEFKEDTKCSSLSPKPFDKLIFIDDNENIKNTILMMYEEYLHQAPFYMEIISSEFKTLLLKIAREYNTEVQYPSYFEEILAYIDKIYLNKISNEEIAKKFGFNKNYLSNIFKEFLGVSLHRYINNKRALYAQQLLVATDMTVLEISDETGFSSQNRFTEFFKNKFQVSPTEYRKALRNEKN